MKTHELAWAAGFFDGEGHIASQRRERHKDPQRRVYSTIILDVRQVDRRALDRFASAIGAGKVYGPWKSKNPNARPFYCFSLSRAAEVQHAIDLLWPWLGPVKRMQAKNAIDKWIEAERIAPGRKPGWGKPPLCHPDRPHHALRMCWACYRKNRRNIQRKKGTTYP